MDLGGKVVGRFSRTGEIPISTIGFQSTISRFEFSRPRPPATQSIALKESPSRSVRATGLAGT